MVRIHTLKPTTMNTAYHGMFCERGRGSRGMLAGAVTWSCILHFSLPTVTDVAGAPVNYVLSVLSVA